MNLKCSLGIHSWKEDTAFDDDWGDVEKAYYCTKCGLIKQVTFGNVYKFRRYYREWIQCFGWGAMIGYDTIFALSLSDAIKDRPAGSYTSNEAAKKSSLGHYIFVERVSAENLRLSNDELGKLYGSSYK